MPITELLSEHQKRKRVWRRVQYLVFFVVFFIIALALSFEYRSGQMDNHQDWIENYGEKLIDNYEPLLVQLLKEKSVDKENLDTTVSIAMDTLRNQPVVIEASLFDSEGQPVLKQVDVPAAQLLSHYSSSSPQIFIRELFFKKMNDAGSHASENYQPLGYLRITLDREFIIKQNAEISESKSYLMALLGVVALLSGMAIGGRFTKWRFKI